MQTLVSDDVNGRGEMLLVHHAANRDHAYPPGCLEGLRACLEAGARLIEVDISPMADGDFLLYHDDHLDGGTTGQGSVAACTMDCARDLRLVWKDEETPYSPSTLSQALGLLTSHSQPVELQLDLKPHAPLTEAVLAGLVRMLEPYGDRVRVSSAGDWAIRSLHALAPSLRLGYDPLLYIEPDMGNEKDRKRPPYRVGAYGYRDDHPLAMMRWGSTADYLSARAEALWTQMPIAGAIWYIRASLLGCMLDDGFDWISYLHRRGAEVDAWTLDAREPEQVILGQRLAAAGADRVTTNDAPALAIALGNAVEF